MLERNIRASIERYSADIRRFSISETRSLAENFADYDLSDSPPLAKSPDSAIDSPVHTIRGTSHMHTHTLAHIYALKHLVVIYAHTHHTSRLTSHMISNPYTHHLYTHHASHITHHTSHITHHTSYITYHTSHITHHITHHTSHITHNRCK